MRILVTGSSGFVGHHIVNHLWQRGHDVVGLDRVPRDRYTHICTDIVSADISVRKFDAVVHAAAYADIKSNWEDEVERAQLGYDNVTSTECLLDRVAGCGIKKFVFLSTASVYPSGGPWRESEYTRCISPYAATKLYGEAMVQAYGERYGWETPVARLTMCIGEGYHHGHVVDFVRMAQAGKVIARDNGANRKHSVHVEDAAEAICDLVEKPTSFDVYNVASEELWNWTDTVRVMGLDLSTIERADAVGGWVGDSVGLRVHTDRIRKHGWKPKRTLGQGCLEALETVGWKK
jgi:UDP-glucose 4-epimerase